MGLRASYIQRSTHLLQGLLLSGMRRLILAHSSGNDVLAARLAIG
jgi:hypothetical protein